ncbi:DUF6660 family protein [Spirosoma fluminis]
MKWLTVILSVWVLILSAVPCCEVWHQDERTNQTTVQPEKGCPDDCSTKRDSPCSPFCSCQTCPGFTVPMPVGLPVAASRLLPLLRAEFRPLLPVSVALPIWQPPQLV